MAFAAGLMGCPVGETADGGPEEDAGGVDTACARGVDTIVVSSVEGLTRVAQSAAQCDGVVNGSVVFTADFPRFDAELAGVTQITGLLEVVNAEQLVTLSMPDLVVLGALRLRGNGSLVSFSAPELRVVEDTAEVNANPVLDDISFAGVERAGGLVLRDCPEFATLQLSALEELDGDLIIEACVGLSAIEADRVTMLRGQFRTTANDVLAEIRAPALRTVGTTLAILSNPSIESLGFASLTQVGESLRVENNQSLATCLADALIEQLDGAGGLPGQVSVTSNCDSMDCATACGP